MLDCGRMYTASIHIRHAVSRADRGAVFTALTRRDGAIFFESTADHDRWGRYTIAACCPVAVATIREGVIDGVDGPPEAEGVAAGGRVPLVRWPSGCAEPLAAALRRLLTCVNVPAAAACPYAPGWMGYLGYELGRHFERLPGRAPRDTAQPDMHLAFYDAVAVYDHHAGSWDVVSLRFDDPPDGAGRAADELAEVLHQAESAERPPAAAASHPDDTDDGLGDGQWACHFTPDAYRSAVGRCIEYIAAGDIFQVNLSQRFTRQTSATPIDIYRRLRLGNPAWYSGYIAGDGWAVLSSSPELFLRCRDGHITTRPIKGTRRRPGDPQRDSLAAAALTASEKDNAELAMIIDLLRNDLGRVCRYGSVQVTDAGVLETHPTVFHLVGAIEGDLADGADLADLVAATFPGGSITGAPKIRAMEIIDELEPFARGAYTGGMVHFGVDGAAEMNIVIRTAVWEPGRVHVHVGGGIVADSTPDGEYVETLDKARAVLAAIAAAEQTAAETAPCIRPPNP